MRRAILIVFVSLSLGACCGGRFTWDGLPPGRETCSDLRGEDATPLPEPSPEPTPTPKPCPKTAPDCHGQE